MFDNMFENIEVFSNIVFVRNTGISFGLFSDGGLLNRYFFTSFSIIVGSILLVISFNKRKINKIITIIDSQWCNWQCNR